VDPDAIQRAVFNLLDNAVKWSPDGATIRVELRRTQDGHAELGVRDEGPGIPPADLPFVFDRFYRSPTARAMPGSGLGLAIVRQIAEQHHGSVLARACSPGAHIVLCLPLGWRSGALAWRVSRRVLLLQVLASGIPSGVQPQ
jgi:two-component system sensor histidine kinase MprB